MAEKKGATWLSACGVCSAVFLRDDVSSGHDGILAARDVDVVSNNVVLAADRIGDVELLKRSQEERQNESVFIGRAKTRTHSANFFCDSSEHVYRS